MEPEANIVNLAQREQPARGCYKANLILNAFVAVGLGAAVILILAIFNHSGSFALLSGLFGALLYGAVVFPRILFGPAPGRERLRYGDRNNAARRPARANRRSAKAMALSGFALSSVLSVAAGIGLVYFPANRPLFAFVDAILALVICMALFMLGLCILAVFFGRGHIESNGVYIDI